MSERRFHFISGLPRAGTTLLAAILNQNPRFRAGMTSPLADIMGVVIAAPVRMLVRYTFPLAESIASVLACWRVGSVWIPRS